MGKVLVVPLSSIRPHKQGLREIQFDSSEFKELCNSIKQQGFIGAISVRERVDPELKITYYEIIDGLQRFAASQACGVAELNVDVLDKSDEDVLFGQIMMNCHRVQTKPMEYCHQILRILQMRPNLTFNELAESLGKSAQWIENILKLKNIKDENIRKMVDDGIISLSNAYALSSLPPEEQLAFFEQAKTEPNQNFVANVKARKREIEAKKREGKSATEAAFEPVAHVRRLNELKDELNSMANVNALLNSQNVSDPNEAATCTLRWVLGLDPASIEKQKADFEDRKRQREANKAAREKEKAEKVAAAASDITSL